MKLIILALGLSFSLSSFSKTMDPVEVVGETSQGQDCSYTLVKMDNSKGEITMFLNGPNGNFRAEFKYEKLSNENILVPHHENVLLEVIDSNSFKYTIPAEDGEGVDTVIMAVFNDSNFAQPSKITAKALAESYDCTFK